MRDAGRHKKKSPRVMLGEIFSGRMLVALLMGFSSGLPLLLTGSLLQAWMQRENVDLGTIGLYALVGLPYTVKFLWAPAVDRYTLPFLGRRRGWLLVFQIILALTIGAMGISAPAKAPVAVAAVAVLLAFFSASQDIVIDAYRRESLTDDEQGLGASLYIAGYRVGMLVASGGGLILADHLPFSQVYLVMAAAMAPGILTTLLAPEPSVAESGLQSLYEAVIQPFRDYFSRRDAAWILLFILLYKLGDAMATQLTTPFYLEMGFTMTQIGTVVKLFGFWATILGGLAGGVLILRLGIYRSLWTFGVLQAVSTASFALLAYIGDKLYLLAAVIVFENLATGMATAAFVAFMASLTDKKFTATQYALLSSLIGIPRTLLAAPTGFMAEGLGWRDFFLVCSAIAIPGLMILLRFRGWLQPPEGETIVEASHLTADES